MSATEYRWLVIYDDGRNEEKVGSCPADFADDLEDVPVAIIRKQFQW